MTSIKNVHETKHVQDTNSNIHSKDKHDINPKNILSSNGISAQLSNYANGTINKFLHANKNNTDSLNQAPNKSDYEQKDTDENTKKIINNIPNDNIFPFDGNFPNASKKMLTTQQENCDTNLYLTDNRKCIDSLFEVAELLAREGDFKQAAVVYDKILKLNPHLASAWVALGHCYIKLDDHKNALNAYQTALTSQPNIQYDEQLWYGIGLLYEKGEDFLNAESAYNHALRLMPQKHMKGEIMFRLGFFAFNKGEYEKAIKLLGNSAILGSFSPQKIIHIFRIIGVCLEELKNPTEALRIYKFAHSLDENEPKILQHLGWLLLQLDLPQDALKNLTKALKFDEDNINITYMIFRCHLQLKNYTEALDHIKKCLGKQASSASFWCSLGILHAEFMKLTDAFDCFTNSIKHDSNVAETYYNLAILYELCNQIKEANAFYDKCLMILPKFTPAIERKNEIKMNENNNSNPNNSKMKFMHHPFEVPRPKYVQKDDDNEPSKRQNIDPKAIVNALNNLSLNSSTSHDQASPKNINSTQETKNLPIHQQKQGFSNIPAPSPNSNNTPSPVSQQTLFQKINMPNINSYSQLLPKLLNPAQLQTSGLGNSLNIPQGISNIQNFPSMPMNPNLANMVSYPNLLKSQLPNMNTLNQYQMLLNQLGQIGSANPLTQMPQLNQLNNLLAPNNRNQISDMNMLSLNQINEKAKLMELTKMTNSTQSELLAQAMGLNIPKSKIGSKDIESPSNKKNDNNSNDLSKYAKTSNALNLLNSMYRADMSQILNQGNNPVIDSKILGLINSNENINKAAYDSLLQEASQKIEKDANINNIHKMINESARIVDEAALLGLNSLKRQRGNDFQKETMNMIANQIQQQHQPQQQHQFSNNESGNFVKKLNKTLVLTPPTQKS